MWTMRALTRAEKTGIADVLRRLREHFHQWPGCEEHEHQLVAFAYYEGCGDSRCCGALLAEAAPIALGAELVSRHGFRWVALASGTGWRYGVTHPNLTGPIDLGSLEGGEWCTIPSDGSFSAGEATHESLANLVRAVGGTLADGQ